jgi:ABC-2 type transport system permease protein
MATTTAAPMRQLYLAETKVFLREPIAVFFTFLFPLLLLLIIGTAFGTTEYAPAEVNPYPGLRTIDIFVPSMFGIAAANLGLLGMPAVFAGYRETGVLRRYRVTPLSLGLLFVAHALVQFTMLVMISAGLVAIVVVVWGLQFPGDLALMTLAFLLSAALMFSLGFMISGLVRTARKAQTIGAAIFFPGLFLSGATFPIDKLPGWLQDAAQALPMTPMINMLNYTWAGKPFSTLIWPYLLVVGFTLAALLIARTTFKWE